MVGILDGSAVEDLLELLFGLISAVGSRRTTRAYFRVPCGWGDLGP